MRKLKVITICSSTSFYKTAFAVKSQLSKSGLKVVMPKGALKIFKDPRFISDTYKSNFESLNRYSMKTMLMKDHFNRIRKGDAILVINEKKKGLDGFIGGNVLMEIGAAFIHKKPIYILNKISKDLPHYDEVMGVQPIFLDGTLDKLIHKK